MFACYQTGTIADLTGQNVATLTGTGLTFGPSGLGGFSTTSYPGYGTGSKVSAVGTQLTLAAIFTASAVRPGQIMARDADSGGRSFTLDAPNVDNQVRWYLEGTNVLSANSAFTVGKPCMVVAYAGHNNGRQAIFIDGVIRASQNPGNLVAATTPLLVGRRGYTSFEEPFQGTIQMAAMWNRILNEAEIAWLYAEPYAVLSPPRRFFDHAESTATFRPQIVVM